MFKVHVYFGSVPKSLKRTFSTYEDARSAVRKYLRKNKRPTYFDLGWKAHSNPSISEANFKIRRIAA